MVKSRPPKLGDRLRPRELELLQAWADGYLSQEWAEEQGVTRSYTAKMAIRIYTCLGARRGSHSSAVCEAFVQGVLKIEDYQN